MLESPPAPVSRPAILQKEKYPTKDKSSETAEIPGKLGENIFRFGMNKLAADGAGEGVDGSGAA